MKYKKLIEDLKIDSFEYLDIGSGYDFLITNTNTSVGINNFTVDKSIANKFNLKLIDPAIEQSQKIENLKKYFKNVSAFKEAVYDGNKKTFNILKATHGSSFLEPHMENITNWRGYDDRFEIVNKKEIQTVKFSDFMKINKIECIDYLRLMVQGQGFDILKDLDENNFRKINLISMTVEFIQIYRNQGIFSDIIKLLSINGFKIVNFEKNTTERISNPKKRKINKLIWSDILFIKDFTKHNDKKEEDIYKMAILLSSLNFEEEAIFLLRENKIDKKIINFFIKIHISQRGIIEKLNLILKKIKIKFSL